MMPDDSVHRTGLRAAADAEHQGDNRQVSKSLIDHLVITAPSREAGIAYVRETLGVTPEGGGEHLRMGTHNALVRLDATSYLEVIAVNPSAPAPFRPRWFELDLVRTSDPPRLAAWAARTSDIRATVARASVSLGEIEAMARDSLRWLITIAPDGSLPMEGTAPTLIQWLSDPHPAGGLRDAGCSLAALAIYHPRIDKLAGLLKSINFDGPVSLSVPGPGSPPRLVASLRTPNGMRFLGAP